MQERDVPIPSSLEEKLNEVLEINQLLRVENEQLKKQLNEKISMIETKLQKELDIQKKYLTGECEKMHFDLYKSNQSVKSEIKNITETLGNMDKDLKNVSLSVKKTLEVETSDGNSPQKTEWVTEKMKTIKHEELEAKEAHENKRNQQQLFCRIQSSIFSDFPKSEITRLLRKWTTDEMAKEFETSVATVKPIKVAQNESLFLIVLKKKQAKTFKDLLFKNRAFLIKSPILIRSDITYATRLKKSILGLISKRLRMEKGTEKAACQRRFHSRASLHCLETEEVGERIAVYSYKEAITKYQNLLTKEEIEVAYGKLKHLNMSGFDMKATLLL